MLSSLILSGLATANFTHFYTDALQKHGLSFLNATESAVGNYTSIDLIVGNITDTYIEVVDAARHSIGDAHHDVGLKSAAASKQLKRGRYPGFNNTVRAQSSSNGTETSTSRAESTKPPSEKVTMYNGNACNDGTSGDMNITAGSCSNIFSYSCASVSVHNSHPDYDMHVAVYACDKCCPGSKAEYRWISSNHTYCFKGFGTSDSIWWDWPNKNSPGRGGLLPNFS